MRLVHDTPGVALDLQMTGWSAERRAVVRFSVICGLVALALELAAFFADHGCIRAWDVGFLLAIPVFALVPFLLGNALDAMRSHGRVKASEWELTRFTLERASARLFVEECRGVLMTRRHRSLALDEVDSIVLARNSLRRLPDKGLIPLVIDMIGTDGSRTRLGELTIEGVDQREEALDLALRMALCAGLPTYDVTKNDPKEFQVALRRSGGRTSVPKIEGPADYAHHRVSPQVHAPDLQVPPFDANAFESDYRVDPWEPGRSVRIVRPSPADSGFWVVAAVATIVSGLFVIAARSGFDPDLSLCFWMGGATVILLGSIFLWSAMKKLRPHSTAIDWDKRGITVSHWLEREIPFEKVTAIETRAVAEDRPSGVQQDTNPRNPVGVRASWKRIYHVEVWLQARGGGERIAATRNLADPLAPYRQALPLGVELAKSLGVPHRFIDYH